jgi:L-asparagine transporter-like permease
MCWTQPYTRDRTTTNRRNNTTLYVLDTTINTNTYSVVLFVLFVVVCVLCMVVSNTYSVVLFLLFVVVLCLVYGCVQHI